MTQWTSPTAETGAADNRNATTEFVTGAVTTAVSALSISVQVSTAIAAISVSTQISVAIAAISTSTQISNAVTNIGLYIQASSSTITGLTAATSTPATTVRLILSFTGDYDCSGTGIWNPQGANLFTGFQSGISTTISTFDETYSSFNIIQVSATLSIPVLTTGATMFSGKYMLPVGPARVTAVTASTTVYLVQKSGFTGGTNPLVFGYLTARQVK